MHNLAVTLLEVNDSQQALQLQKTVLEKRQRLLPPDHLDTLWAKLNYANTLCVRRRYSEALALQKEVAENMNMSTLDLCGVDLYGEEAIFAKIGSAATYMKSGNTVEKLSSSSLPLGVFHKQVIELIRRKIHDGDYIIMLSDGVMDCITQEKGEVFIKELIQDLRFERPNEIAGCIMKYVLNLSKGRIRDDMTVLVMGFWENKYED